MLSIHSHTFFPCWQAMKMDAEAMTARGVGVLVSQAAADSERCYMFQNLAALVTPSIQSVVEFAKRVPG